MCTSVKMWNAHPHMGAFQKKTYQNITPVHRKIPWGGYFRGISGSQQWVKVPSRHIPCWERRIPPKRVQQETEYSEYSHYSEKKRKEDKRDDLTLYGISSTFFELCLCKVNLLLVRLHCVCELWGRVFTLALVGCDLQGWMKGEWKLNGTP